MKLWLLCENNALGHIVKSARKAEDFRGLVSSKADGWKGFYNRIWKGERLDRTIKTNGDKYRIEQVDITLDDDDLKFALKYGVDYLFDNFMLIEVADYLGINVCSMHRKKRDRNYAFIERKIKEKLCKNDLTFEEM